MEGQGIVKLPTLAIAQGRELVASELMAHTSAGRTFLDFPEDLPLATWSRIGAQLASVSDASAWWIGDWLVFGQERYGDRYRHVLAMTSLSYQTLRNYAWVARRFVPSRRREKLAFQHHQEVTALSDEQQDHWLDLATEFGWSRNELRKQIRLSGAPDGASDEPKRVQLRLNVRKGRVDEWQEAAKRSGRDLAEWIETSLDEASKLAR